MYYVYGINSMGSTWYMSEKGAERASLWSGAPKGFRAAYTKEEADAETVRLDELFKFGSTRHYIELCE